jgi:hypothetical protein
MRKSILLVSLLTVLSAPANADDAFWPAQPQAGTPFNGGGVDRATQTANAAYQNSLRAKLIQDGGCNADILPVWVAQGCSGSVFTNGEGGSSGGGGSNGSGSGSDSGGAAK